MSDTAPLNESNEPSLVNLQFGQEIEMEESGFSFQPILGFELEIDGSVYMYSEGGNLEIFMVGGALDEDCSIAELNNQLAADFMENVGDYDLIEAGTDTLQGITGFLNQIHFNDGEEEGYGHALICSPYVNQYFFILMIANLGYWDNQGQSLFNAIKSHLRFQPQFKPEILEKGNGKHPDLTVETYDSIAPEDDFILTIEKGDVSLLLAARAVTGDQQISITEIVAPGEKQLYHFDPGSGAFSSTLCDQPLIGDHSEVCFLHPRGSHQSLMPGDYRFSFATSSGGPIDEIQIIIRSGRALGAQMFDLNLWFAMGSTFVLDGDTLDQYGAKIRSALEIRLAPFNFAPGKIECFHAAPDELESFSSINLDSDLADCSYMISEIVNNERALNIGLVDTIVKGSPPHLTDVEAFSSGSPGMILSPSSPHACILIRWPAYQEDILKLADAIIQQLIIFSGVDIKDAQQPDEVSSLTINRELAWRLRRHPLFYDAS